MGKKNIVFNEYISQNERFADLFNGVVFKGRQVVNPGLLEEIDSKAWRAKGEKQSYHEYVRDNVKIWSYQNRRFVLALEPEESLHFALPVKYMNYESIQYDREYKSLIRRHRIKKDLKSTEFISGFAETDVLMPVITIGIYLGKKKWSAAASLHEMVKMHEIPKEIRDDIRPFFNQFHVNLVDIHQLKTSEIFTTDLREVFGFLMRQTDKKALRQYVKNNKNFRCLREDAYEVIAVYSRSDELEIRKQEFCCEEGFNMCTAIKEMIEDGKVEGRIEGREQVSRLVYRLLEEGRTEELYRSLEDEECQLKLLEEYGISDSMC